MVFEVAGVDSVFSIKREPDKFERRVFLDLKTDFTSYIKF